jgi:GNAT superfamily N-acetyltransferase
MTDNRIDNTVEEILRIGRLCEGFSNCSREELERTLESISETDMVRLRECGKQLEGILSMRAAPKADLEIRPHRPGDMGFVAYRHGIVYEQEYGFDTSFDAYVIGGLIKFAEQYDPKKDELWIALLGGRPVGSIAIVNAGEREAQLRWLLVEPEGRNHGVGRRLIQTALDFCVRGGYQNVFLWTLAHLDAARWLYEQFGFKLTETITHPIWGRELTEERWDLPLK